MIPINIDNKIGGLIAVLVGSAIVSAIAFGQHLDGEFVWDDVYQVEENATLVQRDGYIKILTTDLWGGADAEATQLYHPVPMLSLWLQAQIFGISMVPFRLGNLALHLCCCVLLYLLLLRQKTPPLLAACCAVFFAVHPSVTEAVMWLTGRHDTLGVACSLSALLLWPRADTHSLTSRTILAGISGLFCALALLSKEPYVVVPILIAVREVFQSANAGNLPLKARAPWLVFPFASIGAVFVLRSILGISSHSDALFLSPAEHLVNFATIIRHYFVQIITVTNGRTIHDYSVLSGWSSFFICTVVGATLPSLPTWVRQWHEAQLL